MSAFAQLLASLTPAAVGRRLCIYGRLDRHAENDQNSHVIDQPSFLQQRRICGESRLDNTVVVNQDERMLTVMIRILLWVVEMIRILVWVVETIKHWYG